MKTKGLKNESFHITEFTGVYGTVYESGEFSKKIYALCEEIDFYIIGIKNGTITDMLSFIELIKSYRISAQTWNTLYAHPTPTSMYDIDKYDNYYSVSEKMEKPKRITGSDSVSNDKPKRIF